VLVRTGHSVINRTPKELLKEIIFVDDASTKPDLKAKFDEHWKAMGIAGGLVKVIRIK
jgi:polypeptide N-acetylgalactosaminyltransferase